MDKECSNRVLGLIPANNEAGHIAAVVSTARKHLPVLVIDDGSIDDTSAVASGLGAEVFRQTPNQGKGAALRAGFKLALAKGCLAVITLDADGQHNPAEIPKFLSLFHEKQPDLIIGSRDFSRMPLVRKAANTLGRLLFSWAVRQPVRDNQSGYRLISRRLMEAMLTSQESGFEFEVEMLVVCLQNKFRLDWVPIQTIYSNQGSHIHPISHLRHFIRMILKTRRVTAPHQDKMNL